MSSQETSITASMWLSPFPSDYMVILFRTGLPGNRHADFFAEPFEK
jgi:hypothetical protein